MKKKLSFDLIRCIELVSPVPENLHNFVEYDLADIIDLSVLGIRRLITNIKEIN